MATIKLGNITLSGFAFGGKSEVITPTQIEKVVRAPQVTQAVSRVNRIIPIQKLPTPIRTTTTTTTVQQQIDWLLLNNIWNDNGVWDDTQSWSDGTSQWLLSTGNWNDNGVWDDTQIWN